MDRPALYRRSSPTLGIAMRFELSEGRTERNGARRKRAKAEGVCLSVWRRRWMMKNVFIIRGNFEFRIVIHPPAECDMQRSRPFNPSVLGLFLPPSLPEDLSEKQGSRIRCHFQGLMKLLFPLYISFPFLLYQIPLHQIPGNLL